MLEQTQGSDQQGHRLWVNGIADILRRNAVSRNLARPLRANPSSRLDPAIRVFGAMLALAAPPAFAETPTGLTLSAYRLEVAGYCSLGDDAVATGFRIERDRLIARDRLDRESVERARMSAWQMAHAEWQNRGLGGFRNWCRTEGQGAARHFRDIATSSTLQR